MAKNWSAGLLAGCTEGLPALGTSQDPEIWVAILSVRDTGWNLVIGNKKGASAMAKPIWSLGLNHLQPNPDVKALSRACPSLSSAPLLDLLFDLDLRELPPHRRHHSGVFRLSA